VISMLVHVVGDTGARLSAVCSMLEQTFAVSSELLNAASIRNKDIDSIVVSADLRAVEAISALKAISTKITRVPKRIFLIDQRTRLATLQAYALGAIRQRCFTTSERPEFRWLSWTSPAASMTGSAP
jgi:hypothetical protein